MKTLMVFAILLSTAVQATAQGTQPEILPSLTYHAIANTILSKPELQLGLELSPYQLKQISELATATERDIRSADIPADRFLLIHKLAREEKRQINGKDFFELLKTMEKEDRKKQIYALHDVLEAKFGEILEPEQMQALRPVAMRLQFPTGLSPFYVETPSPMDGFFVPAPEMALVFLVPSADARLRLAPRIALIEKSLRTKRELLHLTTAADLIRKLPMPLRQRFVQIVGNELTPELLIDSSLAYPSVPSGKFWNAVTWLDQAVQSSVIQQELKISPAQLEQIQQIAADSVEWFRTSFGASLEADEDLRDLLERSVTTRLSKVLNDQQLLSVTRHDAMQMLIADCRSPFDHSEVIEFLELSDDEAVGIRAFAQRQYALFQADDLLLEQWAFRVATASLPTESRQRVELVFGDTWPPEIPAE